MKKKEKTSNKRLARKQLKPTLKRQTGDYDSRVNFKFMLPYQFLLLCKLTDVTPNQVLSDFMDNLSCSSWKRQGRNEAKEKLVDYFIRHGYGQHHYTEGEIRTIFQEMDAIGLLWPNDAKMKLIEMHSEWRDKYHTYWFKKWFKKPR